MAKGRRKPDTPNALPSLDDVRRFVTDSAQPVSKRDIARHFKIKGSDRVYLKDLLKKLEVEGGVERGERRKLGVPGHLPSVAVIEVSGLDEEGTPVAHAVSGRSSERDGPDPVIRVLAGSRRHGGAVGIGDRMLARLTRVGNAYEARPIRRLEASSRRMLGVFHPMPGGGGEVRPADRRVRKVVIIPAPAPDAEPLPPRDTVVWVDIAPRGRGGRIVEQLGNIDDPRALSLLAIHGHGLPTVFSEAALAEAEKAKPVSLKGREDLRAVPLVTIDGEDARDFDDAVFAEPDPDKEGGWRIVVAIADVAHYVRPGSALDKAARERGNSAYFPDRVVPMLPEGLSNDLCSLRPGEERASVAVDMRIDGDGRLRRHRFLRAVIKSAARLTYNQVQAAADGHPDETTGPLVDSVIKPLYQAFEALEAERRHRQPLDLDLPERQVVLDEAGTPIGVRTRPRHASHRLIEAYMILANVAAAQTLTERRRAALFRIHDAPDPDKIDGLREQLAPTGLKLVRGQVILPRHFSQLVEKARGTPHEGLVSLAVLRSQAQAVYSPENIGHFGLALPLYSHFTSPIRRYSDLVVHRALIEACGLGDGGLAADADEWPLDRLGEHLSDTERRAAAAERDSVDRFIARFLADRLGETFEATLSGITRFGIFVTLAESGASGFVPMRLLVEDGWRYDARRGELRRGRKPAPAIGDPLQVRLLEADAVSGSMTFALS